MKTNEESLHQVIYTTKIPLKSLKVLFFTGRRMDGQWYTILFLSTKKNKKNWGTKKERPINFKNFYSLISPLSMPYIRTKQNSEKNLHLNDNSFNLDLFMPH